MLPRPVHLIATILVAILVSSCSSTHRLSVRPTDWHVHEINAAAKDHWVVVTTTDRNTYEGDHFAMDTAVISLLRGGSRTADKEGSEEISIPIDAVASIDVKHVSAWKPFLYPAMGLLIALGVAAEGSGDSADFAILMGVGATAGAVVGAGYFLFWTLPDLFTDRPTYNLTFPREKLPIVIVDSTGY